MGFNLVGSLLRFLALLPALTVHEFCHAYSARRAGDPTPEMHGRVTLNPLAHLDPIGTLAILFLPVGWAKPVPINPTNFRHPSRDIIITSAAGPLSNLVQGIVWSLVLRVLIAASPDVIYAENGATTVLAGFLGFMALINFCLCLFNLIPLGPLDGHHIMAYALPYRYGVVYQEFNQRFGMMVLLGIILLGMFVPCLDVLAWCVALPAYLAGRLLAGVDIGAIIHGCGVFW